MEDTLLGVQTCKERQVAWNCMWVVFCRGEIGRDFERLGFKGWMLALSMCAEWGFDESRAATEEGGSVGRASIEDEATHAK